MDEGMEKKVNSEREERECMCVLDVNGVKESVLTP